MNPYGEPTNPTDVIIGTGEGAFRKSQLIKTTTIDVKNPPGSLKGAAGDGVTDDTDALHAIRDYVASLSGTIPRVIFPAGTYLYTESPNWAIEGLRLEGEGLVVLQYTGSEKAFILDASPDAVYRYLENIAIRNLTIRGTATTNVGFFLRNIVRSTFEDIEVQEVEPTAGAAFSINFAVSCLFKNLIHSLERSTSCGLDGLFLSNSDVGGQVPTNNTFINPIMEGSAIGIRVFVGDNNTFIGGTAESCTTYGIVCGQNARGNNFIGIAMEANGTADIAEAGLLNQYIGCYTAKNILLQDVAIQPVIRGGFHESISIDPATKHAVIADIYIAMYSVNGVISLNGNTTATITNVRNRQTEEYVYGALAMSPVRDRTGITVGASPFVYENTSQWPHLVNISGGTITQILWVAPDGDVFEIAGATTDGQRNGQFLLMPGDSLNISYSVAPTMNYIPR